MTTPSVTRKGRKVRCANCRKDRGNHHSRTLACPQGLKTKVGYISYHKTNKWKP